MAMIDIRPHRRYQFRTDFDIDWMKLDAGDEEETERYEKLDENYYCFTLDFFEHSIIRFDLVIDRKDIGYYEMDRSRNVWIIWIEKSEWMTQKQALELARAEIEDYNNYLNWRDEDEER